MKTLSAVLLVALLALPNGCAAPGKIDVDGICDITTAICTRHDGYVVRDTKITPGTRDSQMTSSKILMAVIQEAYDAKHGAGAWAAYCATVGK